MLPNDFGCLSTRLVLGTLHSRVYTKLRSCLRIRLLLCVRCNKLQDVALAVFRRRGVRKKWQQERKTFLIRYHHLLWWNFFFFLFLSPYSHAMLYMKNPRKWTFASSSVSNSKWINIPRKKRNIYFPLRFSEKENSDGKTFSISSAKASFWLT